MNLSDPELCIETFGLTIIEGMAYGLPAIVPNVGGPTEIVLNGYNGYTIDVTNAAEIARILEQCSDPCLYSSLFRNTLRSLERFK